MNISRENETNDIESELKRRIKQWAEQEGLEVPKDFEQIAELTKIKYSVKPKNWKKNEGTFECYTEDNKKVLVTLLNRNVCDGFSRICITEGYVTKIYLVQKDQKLGVSVSLEEKIIKREDTNLKISYSKAGIQLALKTDFRFRVLVTIDSTKEVKEDFKGLAQIKEYLLEIHVPTQKEEILYRINEVLESTNPEMFKELTITVF